MADGEKWLSLRQAHARLAELGIDVQTIRAWGEKGRFGEVKKTLGGHRRFDPKAVDEVLRKWRAGESLDPAKSSSATDDDRTDS